MPETDPFEQFKGRMEPLPDPHSTPAVRANYIPRVKVPEEIRENLKAVSADEDAETLRRLKKVNEQIEDWKESKE